MRYLLILITLLVSAITASAAPPKLNVEKLFDGSYNTDKTVSIEMAKSGGTYFRAFTVKDNAKLVDKVIELYRKDAELSDETQEIIDGGRLRYATMMAKNNGCLIEIMLSLEPANSCFLVISGPLQAFK